MLIIQSTQTVMKTQETTTVHTFKTLAQIEKESRNTFTPFMYLGEYENYLLIIGKSYDCDAVNESNFAYLFFLLNEKVNDETSDDVVIEYIGGNGGTELLLINPNRQDLVDMCVKAYKDMENYPLLNEDHYIEIRGKRVNEYIKNCPESELMEYQIEVDESDGEYEDIRDLLMMKYSRYYE